MVLELTIVKLFAATPPIVTAVALLKLIPVMVIWVPPDVVPPAGLTEATDVLGANTVIAIDPPGPSPTADVTGVVILFFTPALTAVTLTETVQDDADLQRRPKFGTSCCRRLAETTPPHELTMPGGVATTSPEAAKLAKATRLLVREVLFLILNDSLVVLRPESSRRQSWRRQWPAAPPRASIRRTPAWPRPRAARRARACPGATWPHGRCHAGPVASHLSRRIATCTSKDRTAGTHSRPVFRIWLRLIFGAVDPANGLESDPPELK